MDSIMNIIRELAPFFRRTAPLAMLACLLAAAGCAGTKAVEKPADAPAVAAEEKPQAPADNVKDVKINEYVLSQGDQINIMVYQHEDLSRRIKVPPDGKFFYPMVGEINAKGKGLSEIREMIKKGLSDYKEQPLVPGDEIVLTVYRQPDLSRRITIPPDGYFSIPFVGEVKAEGRTRVQLKEEIASGLSKYINSPQVHIDIAKLSNPRRIVDAEVSIEIVDFGGQKVFVLGEVRNPGVYLADGNMSVVEAISRASGFTLDAKQAEVFLIRNAPGKKREIAKLDVMSALNNADMEHNPYVQSGDIIYVPRTFISNVDRFFDHLARIISPIVSMETGYFIGQQIESQRGSTSISP